MEKVWLQSYQEGVPQDINPDKYQSLSEMFEVACKNYAKKDAFVNMGTRLSFESLEAQSRHFAAYCQEILKLQKGDRIALMMPNLLQYPITLFGALRAGLVVVNVNPLYTARELERQLKDSGAKAIVVIENFADTVAFVLKACDVKHVIVSKIGDCHSFPKSYIINSVVKYIKKMLPKWTIPGHIALSEVLKKGKTLKYQNPKLIGEDIAFLQYTGGTTGIAKGAILTHRNMVANLEQAIAWVKPVLQPGREIIITALPLYHIFSLTANCLTFLELGALNVLITNPRDITGFIKELKKYRFTTITGVNTLFNALLNNQNFASIDFSALNIVLGGGMSVQASVAERWQQVTGVPLLEAYGLTEACPAVCINPMNLQHFNGSVGLPISSTEISVRDNEGQELPINTPGELWVKGPQVMKGYWNKKEETEQTLQNGWLRTGDIVTVNEQGFVKIVDRQKDMIVVSGFNVYPNEVEDVLASLPGIKEVAVVGVLSESGEKVKAFVVKSDPNLTVEKIIDYCRAQLTAYKIPKEIEFRDELPKTNVGKILRRALKDQEVAKE